MSPLRLVTLVAALSFALGLASACADDPEPDDHGTLTVAATVDPDPPTAGQTTLTITVTDAAGAPVTGATVVVDPQMPSHGHGSTETPVVSEVGDGVYTAFPVTFQMPGPWEVTITATRGDDHGSLVLHLTVQ